MSIQSRSFASQGKVPKVQPNLDVRVEWWPELQGTSSVQLSWTVMVDYFWPLHITSRYHLTSISRVE